MAIDGAGETAKQTDRATQSGRLAENVLHFARSLRRAGVPVGSDRIVAATAAVAALDPPWREDVYWTLHACLVSRPEHRPVFDAAFRLFWRDPQLLEKMMSLLMRETTVPRDESQRRAGETRAAAALMDQEALPPRPPETEEGDEIEFDARLTLSADERLKARDFDQMSLEEIAQAKTALAKLSLPAPTKLSRRTRPDPAGASPDWRRTLRASMRTGGDIRDLARRRRRAAPINLVALCDISGSMSHYSRMLLHFLHSVTNATRAAGAGPRGARNWAKTHSFVFGTRLTNITRHLARRDVDEALERAGAEAEDWDGGTRIGAALWRFNRDWSRRVLGQGAVVLLITDGLDRDDPALLAREADRLRLSARRLIWLNPLLRWDGFAPKASGVRALLPRVDSFRAAHNIDSLDALAGALSRPDDDGDRSRLLAMMRDEQR